jgi:lipopolysaccharide assembly outer membrane protein LptD (OstA)
VRGQTLSNAFFWAIGRSHDATLLHDWFTKTGQGFGGEYRYELGGGSQGTVRSYLINENATTYQQSDGSSVQSPAKRSYQVNGGVTQGLPGNLRARANVDYFSDVVTQQRYQQNVYQATNRTRRFGGNVTGNWGAYLLSATLERNDVFYGEDTLTTNGGLPRINFSRAERAIGRAPLYFGIGGEYVTLLRSTTRRDVKVDDRGLTRVDVNPILRIPFTRWPFLTINSAIAWRGTYWSESRNESGVQVPEGLNRRFFDFQARVTGPVFTRIWNTPDNGYAEKFKHVIEPTFGVQRITAIDVFDQIVQLEGTDYIVGGVTRFNYGLNNRLYAKKNVAREILTVALTQSYYTDARAAQYDQHYQSSFGLTRPSKFSAVRLIVRGSPTDRLQAEFSTEYDPNVRTLRTYAATGSINGAWVQASGGWSQRRYLPGLPGFDNPDLADHYLNASFNVRQPGNRLGGSYSFNYDLRRDSFLQQRFLAYYNAQCCGIGVEYQTFNFRQAFIGLPVPQDRRFNISFTLAGIGTFSNFLGAFGGQQGR